LRAKSYWPSRNSLEAEISGGVFGRDVVLQVLDSFFLLYLWLGPSEKVIGGKYALGRPEVKIMGKGVVGPQTDPLPEKDCGTRECGRA
jgi:hypothetical protein